MKKLDLKMWKVLPIWLVLFSLWLVADPNKVLSVTKVRGGATQSETSLCAKLNQYIYGIDTIGAKPYIKLTPKQYFKLTIDYDGICLRGLKPQTSYTFTLNKDIPLGKFKLDRDYTFTHSTGDYLPTLHFKDGGYILPAKGEISLPIETINIERMELSLYRINTNNLISNINKYGLVRMLDSYTIKDIEQSDGYLLWKKRVQIHATKNRENTTALPIGDYLKERKPGVYILTAQEVDKEGKVVYDYEVQTQWFMISDIGLFTLHSGSGLDIYTKRLSTAQPYNNIKLELISKNNELLGTTQSRNGKAHFNEKLLKGKRGLQAKAIYAYGKDGDFSVLDLTRAAHDLSDRGVSGRDNPGKYDAYIYSNRAIFRPTQSVPIEILVRDSGAQADLTLSLKVFDAQEVEVSSKLLTTDALGYAHTSLPLSQSASRGKWHVKLYAGEQKPIGSLDFLVEDFVPPKVKIEIDKKPQALYPNKKTTVEATVQYLNNRPLADAVIEGNIILRTVKEPFKHYTSYSFGDATERFGNILVNTFQNSTDANGKASLSLIANTIPKSTLPLFAHVTLTASEPGGRPVERSFDTLVAKQAGYIGLKAEFEKSAIDMNAEASFSLIYTDGKKLLSQAVEYRVVEEQVHWNWRSQNDGWSYYKTYSDKGEISRGRLHTSSSNPTALNLKRLEWGSYRLEVKSGDIVTTYRFTSGYEESMSKSSPDRLPLAIDKQSYKLGESVKVNITPKFDGPIMVSVANHNIIETKTIEAKAMQAQELEFVVDERWGHSTYILATAFKAQSKRLGANRAIGLAHIKVNNPKQKIELTLHYEKEVKSSQATKVTIEAKDASHHMPIRGESYCTLAAVDDAILRLTNYQVPNPEDYFFAQQKLGIEIRDIYGDLIKTTGAYAKFDVGAGDEELVEAKYSDGISNRSKIVTFMSKKLQFDSDGKAEIMLDIPDYQGSLKLMAVAWNKDAIGSQSADMIVKDTIAPELYLPRFISVGDRVKSLLSVAFDTGAESGDYEIVITNENAIQRLAKERFDFHYDGSKLVRFATEIEIKAPALSDEKFLVEVIKDGITVASKEWELAVRAKYPQAYIKKMGLLKSHERLDKQKIFNSSAWRDIHTIALKLSGKQLLPTASLSNQLIEYSGRCAEQTTSRAMPWLFMPANMAKEQTINRQAIIQNAIERLLNYQKLDGGFGLWSGSPSSVWVSSYVLDFLTRAKAVGYSIPDRNINVGLDWLENHLDRWSDSASKQEADAYALYLLTRSGRTLISEMLFHAKNTKSKIRSAQAWGHLASAFAFVGEKELAVALFKKAKKSLANSLNTPNYFSNYGGGLRDEASLVVLMIESNVALDWESSFADLALTAEKREYFSTQEMSLLLRASFMAHIKATKLQLSSAGKALPTQEGTYTTKAKDIRSLPLITNDAQNKIWYSLSYKATPTATSYSSSDNNGFTLSKKIYTMDGTPVDLNAIEQNDRLVIVLDGLMQSNHPKHPLITDWVPAGFELENPNINGVDATTSLKWLGKQTPVAHVEYRDDRYIAALQLYGGDTNHFKRAYIVRAVSQGAYTFPPAKIEDMYQPYYRALSRLYQGMISITKQKKPSKEKKRDATLQESDYLAVNAEAIKNLDRYTIVQLNFLRNSIFAHAGFDFEKVNPMLHTIFSNFAWYHPNQKTSDTIYQSLSSIQKSNIQRLLTEEKRRGGGLVLRDFYRVSHKLLSRDDLKKYNKEELSILRNSLFARRGVRFNNEKLQKIFASMPWYKPTDITSSTIFDEIMTEQEKANVQLIIVLEKELIKKEL